MVQDTITPVRPAERIDIIDVLRGVALFGILAANMRGFVAPHSAYFDLDFWTWTPDKVVQGLLFLFIQGKFITIFAFLFGLGFAIQMTRADDKGMSKSFYLRRLFFLAVFGVIHAFLIWWGDILLDYALMGFVLFAFHKRSAKFVGWSAVAALVLLLSLPLGFRAYERLTQPPPPQGAAAAAKKEAPARPSPAERRKNQLKDVKLYATGSYAELTRERVLEWGRSHSMPAFLYLMLLVRFLLGLWAWRAGIVQRLGEMLPRIRRVAMGAGAAGLVGIAVMVSFEVMKVNRESIAGYFGFLAMQLGTLALSLCYVSLIVLAFHSRLRDRMRPFAAVGRMALTNYIGASLILTWLFRLTGLYGNIGPLMLIAPTLIFYALQVAWSNWWLARYQYGPLEWLWRCLTYGRMQPMRKRVEPPADALAAGI